MPILAPTETGPRPPSIHYEWVTPNARYHFAVLIVVIVLFIMYWAHMDQHKDDGG